MIVRVIAGWERGTGGKCVNSVNREVHREGGRVTSGKLERERMGR